MRWLAVLVGCAVEVMALPAVADPVAPAAAAVPHFELRLPFFEPLRFSFDGATAPGYETLRLPTFHEDATWLERGPLSLHSVASVQPAFELDCRLVCAPVLESSVGLEGRAALGGLGRAAPETWLFLGLDRAQRVESPDPRARQGFGLVRGGYSGLLNF